MLEAVSDGLGGLEKDRRENGEGDLPYVERLGCGVACEGDAVAWVIDAEEPGGEVCS